MALSALRAAQYSSIGTPSTSSSARIRPAIAADAGVVQARDVGMLERGEQVALARHAPRGLGHRPAHVRQFDGHAALEQTVDAFGHPHRAHTAAAQPARQPVGAHRAADVRGFRRRVVARQVRRTGELRQILKKSVRGLSCEQFAKRAP